MSMPRLGLLRTGASTLNRTLLPRATERTFSATPPRFLADKPDSSDPGAVPDSLSQQKFKGRTGGGEPLDASAEFAAPKPKISNLSVPGKTEREDLTEEQRKEVDEHNADFEKKHDHGASAPDDKVDKKYWSGQTQGKP